MAEGEIPVAYYDTAQLRAVDWPEGVVRSRLATELRDRGLSLALKTASGTELPVRASSRKVEAGTALMALAFLHHAEPGAEKDAVVAGPAHDLLLASFWWEPGRLVVAQRHHTGLPGPGGLLRPDGPSEEVLRERYQVGRLVSVDRSWDAISRGFVEEAYRLMSEEEREIVSYLPLHRVREPVEGSAAARYFGDDDPRIELYDSAMSDAPTFVGELTHPQPYSLYVLMHELGHGLMYGAERVGWTLLGQIRAGLELDQAMDQALRLEPPSEERDARIGALQARMASRKEAAEAVTAWLRANNTVLDAYILAVGDEPAPTRYGRTRGREAFAESFALWHLDRPALQRAAPRAAAFFEAGEHVRAVQQATHSVTELASRGL